jgi:cysteine desulfuration protein SufE
MQTVQDAQREIVDEFSMFEDWQEKYAHIIELGRELEPIPDAFKDEGQVWLQADLVDGRLHLQAESDALIVQGLIAILMRVYQDRAPAEILNTDLGFLERIGLLSHLSMNRTNGLNSMVNTIRAHAAAHAA